MTRREFLGALGPPAALGVAVALDPLGMREALARAAAYAAPAEEAAGDEGLLSAGPCLKECWGRPAVN